MEKKSKMFLDPQQPLHTCTSNTCDGCTVLSNLNCHYNLRQLLQFLSMAFPPFIIGGYGIYSYKPVLLFIWVGIILFYFGVVEIRVMCSHCPHYAEPNLKSLKCWANYGSPKLWKYRPGPMSFIEKFIFLIGMVVVFACPLPIIILSELWLLLIIYILTTTAFFFTLNTFLCTQCINFACPFNRVKDPVRNEFFKLNPQIKKAWGKNL